MLGTLDREEQAALLRAGAVGRLGLRTADGVIVLPMSYGYDGDALYFHSRPGEKLRLLRADPRLCFQIDAIRSPADWRSVLVHGRFEELMEPAERERALALIIAQGGQPHVLSLAPLGASAEDLVVFRVRIEMTSGRFERHDAVVKLA